MSRAARRKREKIAAQMAAIYAQVPKIECKGLCANTCALIPVATAELKAFVKYPDIKQKDDLACRRLTADRRCSMYQERPLICRLWGVVDNPLMRCPHGCKVERYLTDDETDKLLVAMGALGGDGGQGLGGYEMHLGKDKESAESVDRMSRSRIGREKSCA